MLRAAIRTGEAIYERQVTWEKADLYLLGIPWEGGISFRSGTAHAPRLIQAVSTHIDHYSPDCEALENAQIYLEHLPLEALPPAEDRDALYEAQVLHPVMDWVREVLRTGKPFGVIGGDHSVPIGVHRVLSQERPGYALLHLDAHADLRPSYQGMRYSHATVLYHASQERGINRLLAVGVRDWDRSEVEYARLHYPRIQVYEMRRLFRTLYQGRPWSEVCSEIVSLLPENVYISLDVDVLEVGYVPNTGTPVPGGLNYEQLSFLLDSIVRSGRKIIGFDLCETGGAEIDAIVSAHLLYRLCGLVLCGGSS
jgi:agmatinase